MVRILMIIGAGSFLGGVSRFLVSRVVQNSADSGFPFGTMVVNILGCLIIGVVYGLAERGTIISPGMRLFLAVGFCGGFTTFSAFAAENIALLRDVTVKLPVVVEKVDEAEHIERFYYSIFSNSALLLL